MKLLSFMRCSRSPLRVRVIEPSHLHIYVWFTSSIRQVRSTNSVSSSGLVCGAVLPVP